MMTRKERAKIFTPFDAMKGLQEALRDREERHTRVQKRDISDEAIEVNSRVLLKLKCGDKIKIEFFRAFHDVSKQGRLTRIDYTYKYLFLGNEKIFFDDIYSISVWSET